MFTPLYSDMDIGRVVGVRGGGVPDTSPPSVFFRPGRQTGRHGGMNFWYA